MFRIFFFVSVIGLSSHLFLPNSLIAQEKAVASFSLDHVALSVQDVDRSAAFYKRVFDLNEILNRTEVDGVRWFSLGEGKELHLISVIKEPVTANKAVHFALTTPNFDHFLAMLNKSNINYSSWQGEAGVVTIRADNTRQLYLQDVDGYWIEINSVASD